MVHWEMRVLQFMKMNRGEGNLVRSCKLHAYDKTILTLTFQWVSKSGPYELEDARFIIYEDEREVIATYISTYGSQRNHIKAT